MLDKLKENIILENIEISEPLDIHSLTGNSSVDFNIIIKNSVLKSIKGEYLDYNKKVEFDNCKIESISFQGITVNNTFSIKNCEILTFVDFACSVFEPNEEYFIFENNIFNNVITFEDCDFRSPIKMINNNFIKGSDLNTVKDLGCYYPENSIIENNKGNLELTVKEEKKLWDEIQKTLPNNG